MNLGENIYRLRTQRNMSQGDLADVLGVSRQSVSKWENNSATPELEKLLSISDLFGVTLDELAGRENPAKTPPAQPAAAQPQVIYIEKPASPRLSRVQLIGLLLSLGSLVYALLLNGSVFSPLWAILLALPVAGCGLICLFVKYPRFYCSWVAAGAYWLYLLILCHHNWEDQYFLLVLGVVLVIAMIFRSVTAQRRGLIQIPIWLWVLGAIVLVGAFVLLWVNVVPPLTIATAEHSTQAIGPKGE